MSACAATSRASGLARGPRRRFRDAGHLAEIENLPGRGRREQVHGPGDDPGPACLMARAEAGPVVAVEILVEQEEVPPVRVLLKLPGASVNRPPSTLVSQEYAGQPVCDVLRDLVQGHVPPGARRTFHGELLAV